MRTREYKDGPNFDQRNETENCVLYAIRNGGFSSGPMPQNIVTGAEAEALAEFVSEELQAASTTHGATGRRTARGSSADARPAGDQPRPGAGAGRARAASRRLRRAAGRGAGAARAAATRCRPELEEAQAERNGASEAIGEAKRAGEDASAAIAEMQAVSARVKELEPEVARLEAELDGAASDAAESAGPVRGRRGHRRCASGGARGATRPRPPRAGGRA